MLQATWDVMLELSPWLLLGAVVAGVLHVVLPRNLIRRQLRGPSGVLKAVGLGVPLPLCSCGVIPAGLGLKKDGASDGSAIGFLISTPQTGVDSIFVSAAFLGWPFAVFKLVSAAVLGLAGGLLTDAVAETPATDEGKDAQDADEKPRGLRAGVEHGVDLIRTIWKWLLFGVVTSAALTTFLPEDSFSSLAAYGGALAMGAILAVAVPLYVCATASVPIAAALVAAGFPPGAALVFLMAGPATNVATIGAVYRTFGGRTLAVYLVTIVFGSAALGMLFDWVLLSAPAAAVAHQHGGGGAWWEIGSAVALTAMLGWFAIDELRVLARKQLGGAKPVAEEATVVEIPVEGMTCNGCVRKLERILTEAEGVQQAQVLLEPGSARVVGALSEPAVCELVRQAGFEPKSAA